MDDLVQRTERTKLRRERDRGRFDRTTVYAILDATPMCHFGYVIDGKPAVTPTLHWRDGDMLYWHGAAASRALQASQNAEVCVTVTLFDGLVLARSGFLHSVNYRSVMVFGTAVAVTDTEAKLTHLQTLIDGLFPNRWDSLRPATSQELNATSVLSLPIEEASAKVRTGGPSDPEKDCEVPVWAGVVPIQQVVDAPIPDERLPVNIAAPPHVTEFSLRRSSGQLANARNVASQQQNLRIS